MLAKELEKVRFFDHLDTSEIEGIAGFVEILELKEGEILFQEGSHCRDLYFILEGRFNILLKMVGAESIDDSSTMTTVKTGELIGELSFLDGAPRSATVQVRNDAKLIRLPYEDALAHFQDHPHTAYKIMEKIAVSLATRVRNVNLMWRNSVPYS